MIQLKIARSIFSLGENSKSSGDKEICLYEGTRHLMKLKSSGILDEVETENITQEINKNIEKCPRFLPKLVKCYEDLKEEPTNSKADSQLPASEDLKEVPTTNKGYTQLPAILEKYRVKQYTKRTWDSVVLPFTLKVKTGLLKRSQFLIQLFI